MDVTRRLREPAAWLLLAAVLIAAVSGIVDMLSGLFSSDDFPIEASNASYQVLAAAPVAMSFFAVLLAIKFGPVLERARVIVMGALGVQCLAALVGVIAWISTLFGGLFSSASDSPLAATTSIPGLLLRFVEGGVFLALLGLAIFYSVATLKLPELAPAPKPQQGFGPYPGAPGGYPGMQPGPQTGQAGQTGQTGQTGQQQPYGQPPGQPGYPSGQQAPMSGYQPQEYSQPDSTYQMPSVGEPSGPQQPGPGFAGGPQPGYPAPSEPSGPQFTPPPGQGGQGGQPGWPGGYGQQSGPQQPQPGQSWPSGFGQEAPQTPDPYGQGGFGQPGPSGPGTFGQEAPSPYQEPPSPYQSPPQYDAPGFGEEPSPFGGTQQPEAGEPRRPGAEQQNGGGFDALFGGRPDADEPDDVQRTSRIEHDPEAFRRYQPPPGDQQ